MTLISFYLTSQMALCLQSLPKLYKVELRGCVESDIIEQKKKGKYGGGGDMNRLSYPSDLTEKEWAILEPLIPPAKPGGHPRTTDMREVINAILYLDRTGRECACLAA